MSADGVVYGTPADYPPSFKDELASAIGASPIVAVVTLSTEWDISTPHLVHQPGKPTNPGPAPTKLYTYPDVSTADFIVPGREGFSYSTAAVAHSRSLQFVKDRVGGPWFDLEAIWEEHTYYEFDDRSVEKTMGTMVLEPYVNHIPTVSLSPLLRDLRNMTGCGDEGMSENEKRRRNGADGWGR